MTTLQQKILQTMFRPQFLPILPLFLAILTPFLIKMNSKNTCSTYLDYLIINFGGDCQYNPDVDLTVPQIIKKYTGDVQIYNVTTQDGYILTMFRIFRKKPVGVVLLQPPISAGSIAWLSDGAHSLGISLWNKGYDVWLSNHRGASYSRQHLNLTESDPEFWNFSFHEIALYDLDAQFKVINKETNSKIIYIGYSMSSTEALIYASLKPEASQKYVHSFILMAPLSVLKHFSSFFKHILYATQPFQKFFEIGEFMTLETVRWLAQPVTVVPYIVNMMTSVVMGWTPTEMDPVLFPYIFAHHGRGMANKMVNHYGQIFLNHSSFSMYDYGKQTNRLTYGSDAPPYYPLRKVRNPMYIIYGDRDRLATPLDVKILCEEFLPKEYVSGIYSVPNHNHIDFMFSRHRRTKTYHTVFTILDKIKQKN